MFFHILFPSLFSPFMYIYVYFTIPTNNLKYEIVIKTHDFLPICVIVILFSTHNYQSKSNVHPPHLLTSHSF